MKILCIDDDITFLTMYRKVLEKHLLPEDEIVTAPDPEQAIDLLLEQSFDLVITDLVMPKMTGIDILRKTKEINASVEVIVVTGQGSVDSAVEAMRLGARDYLTKPLNHGMLIEKIQNIREFISRTSEAEEYRYAKETIESNAIKTVADMEIKLDAYICLIRDIKATIASDKDTNEKLFQIVDRIRESEEE
jgi:DNA-binding NtrC family response regulator